MRFTLWLQVVTSNEYHHGVGKLYFKTVESEAMPVPNLDKVTLYSYDNIDYGDGPNFMVSERYMDADGEWEVWLWRMVLNPNDVTLCFIRDGGTREHSYFGEVHEQLIGAGWMLNE